MTIKLAFIGAGSTIFMKNIVGDMLHFEALRDARIALMDIDAARLDESRMVAEKMIETMGTGAAVEATTDRARALDGADFVVTAFQIGGYRPSTVIDFEIPRQYGLRQTIADTLGVGGIMRGLRTVPHLWAVAEDMARLCPDALLLQYVNPMAINTWALAERFPALRQAGLCHSVQNTVAELAHDLDLPQDEIRYRVAGVNHVAFFLELARLPRRAPAQAPAAHAALLEQGALRGDGTPRAFLHRKLGTPGRIRALVHQAGAGRSCRGIPYPPRRVSAALRRAGR
jgi:alpha-galactosidase